MASLEGTTGTTGTTHSQPKVILKGSSRLDTRTLGTVWTETAEVRRALLVGLCYPATNAAAKLPELHGSWNDVTDMQDWRLAA